MILLASKDLYGWDHPAKYAFEARSFDDFYFFLIVVCIKCFAKTLIKDFVYAQASKFNWDYWGNYCFIILVKHNLTDK